MDPVCYRHPNLRAGVACQRCERPICPDCMTPASVGFHCPECVKQSGQKIYKPSQLPGTRPIVTQVLIGINAMVFIIGLAAAGATAAGSQGSDLLVDYGLWGPAVAAGEWYRIFTAGFLHAGLIHIGFNMYVLFVLGRIIEPAVGSARYLLLYLVSLLAGSLGVLILDPGARTVGASGAVFGLMAAALIADRYEGIDPWRSGIAPTIGINLLITFLIPGISIGGHIGGLIGGAVAAVLLLGVERRTGSSAAGVALCCAFGVACAIGCVVVAQAAYPGLA